VDSTLDHCLLLFLLLFLHVRLDLPRGRHARAVLGGGVVWCGAGVEVDAGFQFTHACMILIENNAGGAPKEELLLLLLLLLRPFS